MSKIKEKKLNNSQLANGVAIIALILSLFSVGISFWAAHISNLQLQEAQRINNVTIEKYEPIVYIDVISPKMSYVIDPDTTYLSPYVDLKYSDVIKNSDGSSANDFNFLINVTLRNLGPRSIILESVYQSFSCGRGTSSEIIVNPRRQVLLNENSEFTFGRLIFVHYLQIPQRTTPSSFAEEICYLNLNFTFDSKSITKSIPVRVGI